MHRSVHTTKRTQRIDRTILQNGDRRRPVNSQGGYKPGVSLSVPARSFPKLPLPWAVREFSGGTARRNELSESTTRNTHSFLLWHSFVIATLAVAFLWFLPKFEVKRPRQRPFD